MDFDLGRQISAFASAIDGNLAKSKIYFQIFHALNFTFTYQHGKIAANRLNRIMNFAKAGPPMPSFQLALLYNKKIYGVRISRLCFAF